jgi:hypothetical protein
MWIGVNQCIEDYVITLMSVGGGVESGSETAAV